MSLCVMSPGVSDESQQIAKYINKIFNDELKTMSLGWRNSLIQDLEEIQDECSEKNWDGYQADPISPLTIAAGKEFLRLLPDHIAKPEIVPETEGEIGFLWKKGREITFLLSVNSKTIFFVEKVGSYKSHGEMKLQSSLPDKIKETLLNHFYKS